jgi:hypothetical protein
MRCTQRGGAVFVGHHAQRAVHGIEQLAALQQEVRVGRFAERLVAGREGLVKQ